MNGLLNLAYAIFFLYSVGDLNFDYDNSAITQIDTTENVLFLSLDDGINADPHLLEYIFQKNISGTAFLNGNIIKTNTDWIKFLASKGWDIAGHSYNHKAFTQMSTTELLLDTAYTSLKIFQTTEQLQFFLRPPYGAYNKKVESTLAKANFKIINFKTTNSTADFIENMPLEQKKYRIDNFIKKANGGEIILAHFGAIDSYETVKYTFEKGLADGFEFKKISDFLKIQISN